MVTIKYMAGKTPTPPLCKDCKYFHKEPHISMENAYCTKFGKISLVSGNILYEYASIAREYDCKGKYFEPNPAPQKI